MNVRPRRLLILSGLVPTLVAAALCLYRPAALARVEWRVYDMLVRASSPRPPDGRVVIVDVDERSLTVIGQWPWRRNLVAALIDELRDLGASVVALDIVFAEADRYADEGPNPDVALEETLRAGRVILGYALTFDDPGEAPRKCVHHPIGLAIVGGEDEPAADPFFRATGAVCNLPNLAQAAGTSGFMNAAPDPDGILRRVPLVVELDGRIYPALALAAISAATDSQERGAPHRECERLDADGSRCRRGRVREPAPQRHECASRWQEQSPPAISRGKAHLPVCLGG